VFGVTLLKKKGGIVKLSSLCTSLVLLLFLGLVATPARADDIDSLQVFLGTWNGSSFALHGGVWNTYSPINWAIGVTNPGYNNPLLDSYQDVNLAPGNYWLYMASLPDAGNAIEINIGLANDTSITEVFTASGGSAEFNGGYTLVQGSGFDLSFISGPQFEYTPVSEGQIYSPGGYANWVLDLNATAAPEPSSAVLLSIALLAIAFVARKRVALGL
jgi:hypothetical protein